MKNMGLASPIHHLSPCLEGTGISAAYSRLIYRLHQVSTSREPQELIPFCDGVDYAGTGEVFTQLRAKQRFPPQLG
jgi:hypothetical protein